MGWASVRNGELLDLANSSFDVLLMADRGVRYQVMQLTGREEGPGMRVISIQDLEERLREILQQVQTGESVEVVDDGRTLARVVPVPKAYSAHDVDTFIETLDQMAAEISKHLPDQVDAVVAVREVRRDL